MSSTRSKGETALAKFIDNPERIGKNKPRKKTKNMADAGTPDTNQQPDTGDKNKPQTHKGTRMTHRTRT